MKKLLFLCVHMLAIYSKLNELLHVHITQYFLSDRPPCLYEFMKLSLLLVCRMRAFKITFTYVRPDKEAGTTVMR